MVKFVPALLSHVQVTPKLQPQDHESPKQGLINPKYPSMKEKAPIRIVL
jgi:hypothetical protein